MKAVIVGLFNPYRRDDAATDAPDPEPPSTSTGRTKKDAPTPTRKQAEAARQARVRPNLTPKQVRARDRQASRDARIKAMDVADAAPARTYARDYVDSRWMLSEFLMPTLLLTIVITLIAQQIWGTGPIAYAVMQVTIFTAYGLLAVTVVEVIFNWQRFKKRLQDKYPGESPKGLLFYFVNRCISVRRLRNPRPIVDRGDKL